MQTWTVAQKDRMIFFRSPLAYIILAVFLFICAYFFVYMVENFQMISVQAMRSKGANGLNVQEWVIKPYLQNAGVVLLFFIPLITMRTFSEEKRMGSFELILSYPLREYQLACGKFLFVAEFLLTALLLSAIGPILLFVFADPEFWPTVVGYAGLIFMALSFASMGIFFSSVTQNQIVSASLTFFALLVLWLLSWVRDLVPDSWSFLVDSVAILDHFDSFTKGVLSVPDITYYLSFILAFLGLTVLSMENQRWRT